VTTSQRAFAAVCWLLAVVLARLSGVAGHALSGTSAAFFAPSAYDALAVSRVDAPASVSADVLSARFLGPQARSAYPAEQPQKHSTTQQTANNASKSDFRELAELAVP